MHSVHAQTPASVRLDYQRDASASSCPEEGTTRDAVAARLGRRPFSNDAARTIFVRLTASGTGFSVDITVENELGAIEGSRTLQTEHSDCGELAAAMQLALAIAVDPMHGSALAPPPPPTPSPLPSPSPSMQPAAIVAPPPPLVPSPTLAEAPSRHLVGVGAGLGVGSGAMPSFAATIHYQRRSPTAMWSLEARGELPTEHSTPPGKIRTTHLSAALLGCLTSGAWDFCAMGRLGVFRASGSNFEQSLSAQTPYGALGPRLGWNYGLSDTSRIEVVGEVLARVTNTELTVDERVVWESSAFEMALGARYVWELL